MLVLIIICVVLAIAGCEYFGKVTEKGYRPAVAPGSPHASARRSPPTGSASAALPLVIAFAFIAGAIGFIGARGVESGPAAEHGRHDDGRRVDRPARAFAALILRVSNSRHCSG